MNEPKEKRPRGFAALSPEKRLELQRKGAKKLHESGQAYQYTAEAASAAGKKGSASLHAKNRKIKQELEAMKKDDDKKGGES